MIHGRDCPSRCSICLGAPVQRVVQLADTLVIDGVEIRPIAPPVGAGLKQSSRRGGRQRALRSAPRTKPR